MLAAEAANSILRLRLQDLWQIGLGLYNILKLGPSFLLSPLIDTVWGFLCLSMIKCMPFNSPMKHFLHVMRFFLTIYSFFLRITQFFHSFNYSINNVVKIFIQEFIHSKKMQNIQSKNENYSFKLKMDYCPGLPPTPLSFNFISGGMQWHRWLMTAKKRSNLAAWPQHQIPSNFVHICNSQKLHCEDLSVFSELCLSFMTCATLSPSFLKEATLVGCSMAHKFSQNDQYMPPRPLSM